MIDDTRIAIIGVGNILRSDDGIGCFSADLIKKRIISLPELENRVSVISSSGEIGSLIELWKNFDRIYIIDSVYSGKAPGTIYKFKAHHESIPADFFHYSTHSFSIAEAVELARSLKQLPAELYIYAIEGGSFQHGTCLSKEVEQAAHIVAHEIVHHIQFPVLTDASDQE